MSAVNVLATSEILKKLRTAHQCGNLFRYDTRLNYSTTQGSYVVSAFTITEALEQGGGMREKCMLGKIYFFRRRTRCEYGAFTTWL